MKRFGGKKLFVVLAIVLVIAIIATIAFTVINNQKEETEIAKTSVIIAGKENEKSEGGQGINLGISLQYSEQSLVEGETAKIKYILNIGTSDAWSATVELKNVQDDSLTVSGGKTQQLNNLKGQAYNGEFNITAKEAGVSNIQVVVTFTIGDISTIRTASQKITVNRIWNDA